jgi:hypothetical protein
LRELILGWVPALPLQTFVEQSLPVKDFYAGKGLAHVLSAVPPPDEVFVNVAKVLDPIMDPNVSSSGCCHPLCLLTTPAVQEAVSQCCPGGAVQFVIQRVFVNHMPCSKPPVCLFSPSYLAAQ